MDATIRTLFLQDVRPRILVQLTNIRLSITSLERLPRSAPVQMHNWQVCVGRFGVVCTQPEICR